MCSVDSFINPKLESRITQADSIHLILAKLLLLDRRNKSVVNCLEYFRIADESIIA